MIKEEIELSNRGIKVGIGCFVFGGLLLISAAAISISGYLFSYTIVNLGVGLIAAIFAILILQAAFGFYFGARERKELLTNGILIAGWKFSIVEDGRKRKGFIYFFEEGFATNVIFIVWGRRFSFYDIIYSERGSAVLTIQYSAHRSGSSRSKKTQDIRSIDIPVPRYERKNALKVVGYYKPKCKNADA
ncbi:MAG: hypothetical protein KDB79_05205 [Acidobacteria bacterium]|nr:hypothetical protein [Acidobacteriota bacterium]